MRGAEQRDHALRFPGPTFTERRDAVMHAAAAAGPFKLTVLKP